MRIRYVAIILASMASPLLAQEPLSISTTPPAPVFVDNAPFSATAVDGNPGPSGTQGFPNFIGFMSNPPQNVDPRSLTQIWPMFGSTWVSSTRALPESDFQVYGAGINIALTERLSMGFNNGGFATASFSRDGKVLTALNTLRAKLGLPPRSGDGVRQGFLDIGGFFQYTLIADVENQFLLTGGLNYITPSGSSEIFQGKTPVELAPYLTVGKELGNFHILATTGYKFPTASGSSTSNVYYLNGHLDYQVMGWIYPLVEVNWSQSTSKVSVDLQTREGFINLGNFETVGSTVTLATGVNLVLIRDKLEMGAVYSTPLSAPANLNFNGLLVKLLYRF